MVFARRIEFFGSSVITRQQQAPVQHAFDKRRAVITLFHQPNEKELKATSILKLALTEVSAKVRKGEVEDDPEDYALRVWAGIVPLRLIAGAPERDARCDAGIAEPEYVARWKR